MKRGKNYYVLTNISQEIIEELNTLLRDDEIKELLHLQFDYSS